MLAPACRSKAPDAGGDTALARDLAEVQLRSMQQRGPSDSARQVGDVPLGPDSARTVIVATSPTTPQPVVAPGTAGTRGTVPARPLPGVSTSTPQPAQSQSASAARPRVGSTLASASTAARCGSPRMADQHACIAASLAVSDVRLNRVYNALIVALREQAHVLASAREPRMVRGLRSAQRAWIVTRDRECKRRTRGVGGRLWAPARARCLAEISNQRADELEGMLRATGAH